MSQTDKNIADFNKSWRYKVGLSLIIIGHISLLSGMLLPVLGPDFGGKKKLVGMLIVSGELISLSSIIFLGKNGFLTIKKKIFGFFKAVYVVRVGPLRHYIGIALILTNMLTTYMIAFYAWDAFGATTPEVPMPVVWGLDFGQQESLVLWLFLTGEISFLAGIYVLGADWWERFRQLFIWPGKELNLSRQ